jgi:hypothetical protein
MTNIVTMHCNLVKEEKPVIRQLTLFEEQAGRFIYLILFHTFFQSVWVVEPLG